MMSAAQERLFWQLISAGLNELKQMDRARDRRSFEKHGKRSRVGNRRWPGMAARSAGGQGLQSVPAPGRRPQLE